MFAISTCWNNWRHTSAEMMVKELTGLGFDRIELSFTLPESLFPGILDLARSGRVSVSSLHNYCPPPLLSRSGPIDPDALSLSSLDERERNWAVRQTMRSIDAARALGARAVVLHLGNIPFRNAGRELILLAEREGPRSKRSVKTREKLLRRREEKKRPYLEQAVKSLGSVAEYAGERGIVIGVENRYYIEEIPSLDELGVIFDRIPSPALGYWHDIGHAQVKENTGLELHDDYLRRYGGRLIGMHIHDVVGGRDHQAPLTGKFDFNRVKAYLGREIIRVFEIHPPATSDEIKRGREYLLGLIQEGR